MIYFGSHLPAIKYPSTPNPLCWIRASLPNGATADYRRLDTGRAPRTDFRCTRRIPPGVACRRPSYPACRYWLCLSLLLRARTAADSRSGSVSGRGRKKDTILNEIRELRALYGENRAFQQYAGRLLDLAATVGVSEGGGDSVEPPPEMLQASAELGLNLRRHLGRCATKGLPIPPGWAHGLGDCTP